MDDDYSFRSLPAMSHANSVNGAASSSIGSLGSSIRQQWSFSPDDDVDFFVDNGNSEVNTSIPNRSDYSPSLLHRLRIDDSPGGTPLAFRPINIPIAPPAQKSELSSMLEASGYSSANVSVSSLQSSLTVPCVNISGPSPISVISGPSPCLLRPLLYRETERFFPHCSERSAPIAIPWQKPTPQHADKHNTSRHHQSSSF